MKGKTKKKLLLGLAALLSCLSFGAMADDSEMLELALRERDKALANESDEVKQSLQEHTDSVNAFREAYAPAVKTLSNGVRIQRTPTDLDRVNNKLYQSDTRGCGACHDDLAVLLNNLKPTSHISGWFWGHHDLTNDMGIEATYLQCVACHDDSYGAGLSYCIEMSTMIHAAHRNSAAFSAMGGDCWSCHFVNERTGDIELWDEVKYDVLHGIRSVSNVQGEFRYDQNVLTDEVFSQNVSYPWNVKDNAGVVPDPEHDGVYEKYEIEVTGLVAEPRTWTLAELIETAPIVHDIGTYECEAQGFGGPMIANFEFSGIPVRWLIDQSLPMDGSNGFKNDQFGGPWSFTYMDAFPSYLVYEINGKPIDYKNGYPVMLYCMDGNAAGCIKCVKTIEVIHLDDEMALFNQTFDNAYKFDPEGRMHSPNVGICHFKEGQIIPVGEPYTFEGYAFANQNGIDAIEFSMDNGETWTRFDTSDSQDGKWLYWYFTWTPEKAGGYVFRVRAYDGLGRTFDFSNVKLFNVE